MAILQTWGYRMRRGTPMRYCHPYVYMILILMFFALLKIDTGKATLTIPSTTSDMRALLGVGIKIYKFLKYTSFSASWYFSVSFEDFSSGIENGTLGLG